MDSIWKSRKLWIGIADAVISIVTLVLTAYLSPENLKFALGLVAALQPVIYAIIAGLTAEETASIAADAVILAARLKENPTLLDDEEE